MIEAQKSRAVSGDFMAGSGYAGRLASARASDVIDGDYVSGPVPRQIESGRLKAFGGRPATGSATVHTRGLDVLRRRPVAVEASSRGLRGCLFSGALAVAVLLSFWVSGGHVLLAHALDGDVDTPDSAIQISTVASRIDNSGVRPLLFVDGKAANLGTISESLPALEIAVTGRDGLLTRYRLGTADRLLRPGETFAFSSRLHAPKNGVRIVAVTMKE